MHICALTHVGMSPTVSLFIHHLICYQEFCPQLSICTGDTSISPLFLFLLEKWFHKLSRLMCHKPQKCLKLNVDKNVFPWVHLTPSIFLPFQPCGPETPPLFQNGLSLYSILPLRVHTCSSLLIGVFPYIICVKPPVCALLTFTPISPSFLRSFIGCLLFALITPRHLRTFVP